MLVDSGIAGAQLGTGWTKLTLTQDYIDTQSMGRHARHPIASFTTSGARYEKDGTTETFELYDPSFNRVEHDTNYHYRTGKVQFEGTVQIYNGVNHQFIVQNFNAAGSGPIMALSAFSRDGGVIIKQGGSVEVARNAFGRDIRVNIVHDLDANTLTVFIDGVQAWTGSGGAGGGGFNFKYGSYGSLNGSTSAKARWQNVQLFTGGTAGGGNNPEPAPDAGPVQDAVTGGDSAMIGDVASGPEAGSGPGGIRGQRWPGRGLRRGWRGNRRRGRQWVRDGRQCWRWRHGWWRHGQRWHGQWQRRPSGSRWRRRARRQRRGGSATGWLQRLRLSSRG